MKEIFKPALLAATVACALMTSGIGYAFDLGSAIGAADKITKAATLSDSDIQSMAREGTVARDKKAKVAPASSPYTKRLDKIVAKFKSVDGMKLNYKVYLINELNASAAPDGSVRVNSGLLDKYTDDEVRFVIGHEIGHVALGHTKKRFQMAYSTAAARDTAAAVGNSKVAALSQSALGDLLEEVLNAQFSQSNESESDMYAVKFMKRFSFDTNAAATAMAKMEAEGGGSGNSLLSTHPPSSKRLEDIKAAIAAK